MAEEVMSELIVWSNGMVACFNRDGHQMDVLQGPVHNTLRTALDVAESDGATCYVSDWQRGKEKTSAVSLRSWLLNVRGH